MEKDAIAQNWYRARLEAQKPAEPQETVEVSREEMIAGLTRYHTEHVFSDKLYCILKHRGKRTERTDKAYGFDRTTRYKQTVINLGSATVDGFEAPISTRAVLLETYTSGEDAFMSGTNRRVWFEAKERGARNDHFTAVPDGSFTLRNVPFRPQDDLRYGFRLASYQSSQEALPGLLEFNQQLIDIAEIIGVDLPAQDSSLTPASA